jgi:aspartate kinase
MALIVQKYGGSSVDTPEAIKLVAKRISKLKALQNDIIVVVSAMGDTTDSLSRLAYKVSKTPARRELDMLLSTGERVASSLMSLALNDLGCSSISFTGSQAGILTDDSHTNARIMDLKPIRVQDELNKGRVVVLAGFQGVSPVTKEITTLGRGGTDLTAVAMAHHFKAAKCEILKDVDGVFSGDPKIIKKPKRISEISFNVLQEITFWGAKMLHHRAAELAARVRLPLYIGLAHRTSPGTVSTEGGFEMFEEMKVLSVNSHARVFKVNVKSKSHGQTHEVFQEFLESSGLPWPQILDSTYLDGHGRMLLTAPVETLESMLGFSKKHKDVKIVDSDLSSVTATCAGSIGSSLIGELTRKIEKHRIKAQHVLISPMSATFIVNSKDRESALKTLHP